MDAVLDFTKPLNVALLDEVVATMYDPRHPQHKQAAEILTALKDHPQAWSRVDAIIEQAANPNTRVLGVKILQDAVRYRWKTLPQSQRDAIKTYLVRKIVELAKDDATLQGQKLFVSQLNQTLVELLKQEWPHNWPNFVTELVQSSKTSESLCENNMEILLLLSEEVFDFSREEMVSQKALTLKQRLNSEFGQIYELCEYVLQRSQRASLLTATLRTLQRFLTWIPLGYIFETSLIEGLVVKFLPTEAFRNDTLMCLAEIVSLKGVEQYAPVFPKLLNSSMSCVVRFLPPGTDVARAYEAGTQEQQDFVQRLTMFLTSLLGTHRQNLEAAEHTQQALVAAVSYLVDLSAVPDLEVFKICLEFWNDMAAQEYRRLREQPTQGGTHAQQGGVLRLGESDAFGASTAGVMRAPSPYEPALKKLRRILISRMAKPEEVLVVEDESTGEMVREETRDTDAIALYRQMKEVLVYLTHLHAEHTEDTMMVMLQEQVQGEWSRQGLSRLCWAVGSVSGTVSVDAEKRFLVVVIRELLRMCENKRGKDNKAAIASNIMYVVGQYPQFLQAHWRFLKTVVHKLFEFMHERHPGVQDMACDTFLKIARRCRGNFAIVNPPDSQPFIQTLIPTIPSIISELEHHQVQSFYHSVGYMLSAVTAPHQQRELLIAAMSPSNAVWQRVMQSATSDVSTLCDPATAKQLHRVLRINVRVCSAMGQAFAPQLETLYRNMLQVYNVYSRQITQRVGERGQIALQLSETRALNTVKKEVLALVQTFVSKSTDTAMVASMLIGPLFEPVLEDYKHSHPLARNHEVLSLFTTVVNRCKSEADRWIPGIMGEVFECTLSMITPNFVDHPDIREAFFRLLQAMNKHCFKALFSIPAGSQKLVVDSILWAIKHTDRTIADLGLELLHQLLKNVQSHAGVSQAFYRSFFMPIVRDVLYVLTDRLHKSGFPMHVAILCHMFGLVASGEVQAPLWESVGSAAPADGTNAGFLRHFTASLLKGAFPHASTAAVDAFASGLCDKARSTAEFKVHVRDFLIQLKEFATEDNRDLYREEMQQQAEAQLAQRAAVPGLVNDVEEDDDI